MRDLTQGSLTKHLALMTVFLLGSMLVQSLYLLADMYWVGKLGKDAVAAVGIAANLMALVLAATQSLAVGTTSLVSRYAGQKQEQQANHLFNQALSMAIIFGSAFTVAGFLLRHLYAKGLAADAATAEQAERYLLYFIPALGLQFPLLCLGAALRGVGIVRPTMVALAGSVGLNLVLAPLLIFGWVLGIRLGITGAAVASLVALALGTVGLWLYVTITPGYLRIRPDSWKPNLLTWRELLAIGVPAGAELAVLGIYLVVVYLLLKRFGADAQGGFAIGARIGQAIIMPAAAVGLANAPIVGQNLGANNWSRVRRSFWLASLFGVVLMAIVAIATYRFAAPMIAFFNRDAAVVAAGSDYLRLLSCTFVVTAMIFSSSSVFQGIGNTKPPLLSASLRLIAFTVAAVLLIGRTHDLHLLWIMASSSIVLQGILNCTFLARALQSNGRSALEQAASSQL